MMNRRKAIVLLAALLALAGCRSKITNANLKEVKPEMSTKEVESILGQPTEIKTSPEPESTPTPKTVRVTSYVYQQNGKKVVLKFVGDRLATGGVEGSFDQ